MSASSRYLATCTCTSVNTKLLSRFSARNGVVRDRQTLFRKPLTAHRRVRASDLLMPRVEPLAASASSLADSEPVAYGEYCVPAYVTADNSASEHHTKLTVETQDFPGLLRVTAWVLHGLDLRVQDAVLQTFDDGVVQNELYVTTINNTKLTDAQAEAVAERLQGFVEFCAPGEEELEAKEFVSENIFISNAESSDYTLVELEEQPGRAALLLLDIASVITGMGCSVKNAFIQTVDDAEVAAASDGTAPRKRRRFRFAVTDGRGHQLDFSAAASMLYTLALLTGRSLRPLQVPQPFKKEMGAHTMPRRVASPLPQTLNPKPQSKP